MTQKLYTSDGKTLEDFEVSQEMLNHDMDIVKLIMISDAMKTKDRQHWFSMYEIMNEQQIEQLRKILTNEQKKLDQNPKKYKKQRIDPPITNFKRFGLIKEKKERNKERKEAEARIRQQNKISEDDLLSEFDNL
jgi:hypothetical protein